VAAILDETANPAMDGKSTTEEVLSGLALRSAFANLIERESSRAAYEALHGDVSSIDVLAKLKVAVKAGMSQFARSATAAGI
jgi:hypothetical protein